MRLPAYFALLPASFAAMALGGAQAVSVAAPWSGQPIWWLQIASLALLVALLGRSASAKAAAWLAWLFASSWLCGTVWWLYISMHVYGGLAAPLAALAVWALCGFLALYYAVAAYFFKRFSSLARTNTAQAAIVFAACWTLAELARNSWFTGFPWGAGGYAQVDGPLVGYVSVLGVYGLGAVVAWLAALLPGLLGCGRLPRVLAVTALALPSVAQMDQAWLDRMTQSAGQASLSLLQGNISQGEKFERSTGVKASLEWYQEQLLANRATLVVTPETAIPLLPRQLPDGYWPSLTQRFQQGEQAALVGVPLGGFEQGYTNSMQGLKPGAAAPYQYDKHHLVPFGEFIPPLFKWFTRMMNIPLGDFRRGELGQASFDWAGQRWAPNICYEDLFGDELARRFVDEKTAPTVMVNVSNIAWFGNTVAIDQHLHISRMRAMELGRPMVRATNTGATAIINYRGEVTHSLPRHTRGVLTGLVEGRVGITPYAWWAGRYGLWPIWLLAVAICLIASCAVWTRARA